VIHVLEIAGPRLARAWFAYDKDDLLAKLEISVKPDIEHCLYWDDSDALAAFEGGDPRIAGADGWWARRALYHQLVALEILADDC
jgi:hypothetical protein